MISTIFLLHSQRRPQIWSGRDVPSRHIIVVILYINMLGESFMLRLCVCRTESMQVKMTYGTGLTYTLVIHWYVACILKTYQHYWGCLLSCKILMLLVACCSQQTGPFGSAPRDEKEGRWTLVPEADRGQGPHWPEPQGNAWRLNTTCKCESSSSWWCNPLFVNFFSSA